MKAAFFIILSAFSWNASAASISETFQALSSKDLHFVKSIPLYDLELESHHPQGIKVYGDTVYLTSVSGTQFFGHGYLTRYQLSENKATAVKQIEFSENEDGALLTHAGGIDGNAEKIWIPLSAYRPSGPGQLIEVNLADLSFKKIGMMWDHLGAVAHDSENVFRLFTWGTRGTYTTGPALDATVKTKIKHSRWQYQDCKAVAPREVICSAKKGLIWPKGELHLLRFDGDSETAGYEVIHRIEVPHLQADGRKGGRRPLTYNAMDVVATPDGLRFYFVPHDQQNSHLIVIDAIPTSLLPSP